MSRLVSLYSVLCTSNTLSSLLNQHWSDSNFNEQEKGWNDIEEWYESNIKSMSKGASYFFSSGYFWPYDTLRSSRAGAYSSSMIAIICASVMILLTSQSILVAIYAAISILYVLVASTACLVSLGWELGVFESILFR